LDLELVERSIALPGAPLTVLQPAEVAALPDDGGVEWAPIAPYWAVLWRSGVALARAVAAANLAGRRIVELGCGLGLPSLVAARSGARVLATDSEAGALALLERNARLNGLELETLRADWREPGELIERGPFDLALAADVLYESEVVPALADLLARLAPSAWLADPGRPGAEALLELLPLDSTESSSDGVVGVRRLQFSPRPLANAPRDPL
jgi:predicted nicotinamide N-methyase